MDSLSIDLLSLVASYLPYQDLLHLLSVNTILRKVYHNNPFWMRHFASRFCYSLEFLRWRKRINWRRVSASMKHAFSSFIEIPQTREVAQMNVEGIYHQDLVMRDVLGSTTLTYLKFDQNRRVTVKSTPLPDFDKLLRVKRVKGVTSAIYIKRGTLFFYERGHHYRSYRLLEDVKHGASVRHRTSIIVVALLNNNQIIHLTIPALSSPLVIITKEIDLTFPAPLSNIVIAPNKQGGVMVCGVTSSNWFYQYVSDEHGVRLWKKEERVLEVSKFRKCVILLTERGDICSVMGPGVLHHILSCSYQQYGEQYLILSNSENNCYYTLSNYVAHHLQVPAQTISFLK